MNIVYGKITLMMILIVNCSWLWAKDISDMDLEFKRTFTTSSTAFIGSTGYAVDELERSLLDKLKVSGLGAMSSDQLNDLITLIRREEPINGVSIGKPGAIYDVILQPGHYARTTGKTGTGGKKVLERALVAHLVKGIVNELSGSGLNILVVPADGVLTGMSAKVFLSMHADGSLTPCSTGPSLAYKDSNSLLAMHAIGLALSTAYGIRYNEFQKDNFTANEAQYYMFNKVNTSMLKGLLEVGELTCDKDETELLTNSNELVYNLAMAIKYIVSLKSN